MAERTTMNDMPAELHERLGFNAAAEIEATGRMLRDQQHADGFEFVLHGALLRISELSAVLLALHGGDDGRQWGEMHVNRPGNRGGPLV
jgi:hypothetical protein